MFWRDPPFARALLAAPLFWGAVAALHYRAGLILPSTDDSATDPWWWLQLVLIYPVLEELVFRGALQGWLLERRGGAHRRLGISLANVVTSVAFVGLHLLSRPLSAAVWVFPPSLVFGWARERYGSVLPCMVLHGFYNLGWVWLLGVL